LTPPLRVVYDAENLIPESDDREGVRSARLRESAKW
jgi:hypothetical protein